MLVTESIRDGSSSVSVCYDEPSICPRCNHAIKPELLSLRYYKNNEDQLLFCNTYLCKSCYETFIVLYQVGTYLHQNRRGIETKIRYLGPSNFESRKFPASLENLSPKFIKIYNQALSAENSGLDEIAGIGYRKALEFLVKDYLIHENPEDAETIKKMELGNCIANKVSNEKLKTAASRSAWIGNDMTHYEQRHADLDIEDLKKFIEASIYWVSMELATEDALGITKAGR